MWEMTQLGKLTPTDPGVFHTIWCHAQHKKLRGDLGAGGEGAQGEAGHQLVGGAIA